MNILRSLDVLLALQSVSSPFLDAVMRSLSFLGSEFFYFAILVFLYWGVSRRLSIRLATVTLLSLYVNFLLKNFFALPRPEGPGLRILEENLDFSFPSGHAQSVTSFFFFLALSLKRSSLFVLAGVLAFLVSLSRLYLGVHYVQDVLGGVALGFAFALGFWILFRNLLLKAFSPSLGLLVLIPAGCVLFFLAPSHLGLVVAGSLTGALAGYLLSLRIGLEERVCKATTYLLGVAGLVVLYLVGKRMTPPSDFWLFFRYFLLNLFATFGFPLLATFREQRLEKTKSV